MPSNPSKHSVEALITLTAPQLEGGIGRNIINLCHEFLRLGLRVDLVLDQCRGPLVADMPSGVRCFESGGSHPIFGVPWLMKYIARFSPHAILTPIPRQTAWAWRARLLTKKKPRLVVNVHNNYLQAFGLLSTVKRRSRQRLIQRVYPQCDAIIPVSQGAATAFASISGIPVSALTTIPNPVVTDTLYKQSLEPVDHAWFASEGPPVIVWVGRMEPQKDLDTLLEAFEILRHRRQCRLVLIGDGSEMGRLRRESGLRRYRTDIDFIGYRQNPYAFMRRAQSFALSSRWEGFGNVLVEAMALGTPVASVDCPSGPAEILENGGLGPLGAVGDASGLAAAIEQTLDAPTPSAHLRRAALRYDAARVAGLYLSVLLGDNTPYSSMERRGDAPAYDRRA